MSISAEMVKELRERTGAGMMECKRALVDSHGDISAAIENMRKAGLAKADKKAGRIAAEGRIAIAQTDHASSMVEINSETDFVANCDDFVKFVENVAHVVLTQKPRDVQALMELPFSGDRSVDTLRRELVAKLGENISIRRCTYMTAGTGTVGAYCHGSRIGVLVEIHGGTAELAKDIAMHIAASKPICVKADQVPGEVLEREREIIRAQSMGSNKPAAIIEKMIEGRLRKFIAESTLLGQAFVKDPEITVDKLLAKSGAQVKRFERYEVGEGIDRKQEDFAAEVMAQARGL
ncbi:MAG: elongation factor Ts [Gammaproteobacteria bacterium]|nr:elongation factor Ts [Gammaproteobacteria bacterium]MDE2345595.1 elongation factor Ts [Gammaproteobacteria bacterium]